MSDERHTLRTDALQVGILAKGAELCSLLTAGGAEAMWQAGPAWPRHAPLLFPIVGELKDHRLLHGGKTFEMGRHGFARDRLFTWQERTDTTCRLALDSDAETLAQYPFPFRLEVAYTLRRDTLQVEYTVINTGDGVLPASVGGHPAFNWPLAPGLTQDAHRLRFEAPEPEPIQRLTAEGLVKDEVFPTPIEGDTLSLRPALFEADAIIMPHPASRQVHYSAPGAPAGTPNVTVGWDGMRQLGIWSKPNSALLCIEPWRGFASPAAFEGEFTDKPGLMHIQPGARDTVSWWVRIGTEPG